MGLIRPLHNHNLGGLANGLAITGMGTARLKFRTKHSALKVTSSDYYVPNARDILISPQRWFNDKRGMPGKFVVEEARASLFFDGVGETVVDYDTGSNLPTTLGKNFVHGQAEVNLTGVLNENNANLLPSQ